MAVLSIVNYKHPARRIKQNPYGVRSSTATNSELFSYPLNIGVRTRRPCGGRDDCEKVADNTVFEGCLLHCISPDNCLVCVVVGGADAAEFVQIHQSVLWLITGWCVRGNCHFLDPDAGSWGPHSVMPIQEHASKPSDNLTKWVGRVEPHDAFST